ncbi:hypothetical protein QBC38DRAFT_504851 [Podospora fimiseda]|uniref:Uncharacterized protein n=1 Tax=Podospora fimiseda TaxID=252190 RepID=A0AAN7BFE8_9PEZI|nr:hypothetical protein QBC38DRAFT_504851 [Podospora fimiseda]
MMFTVTALLTLPLLIHSAQGWGERHEKKPVVKLPETCTADVTVTNTTTVEVTHYVDHTVNLTTTQIITECTTTTLFYTTAITATNITMITNTDTYLVTVTNTATDLTTVTNTGTDLTTVTDTDSVTVTTTDTDAVTVTTTDTDAVTITTTDTDAVTITTTDTDSVTITTTDTDSVTITTTDTTTTTETVPATTTTWTTQTIFSTTYDPCPKFCSVSAATVNLYYWPTNRPYTYPSTHVDTSLGYTFTSPSVYMLIPTAVGINSLNQTVGPSTTSWILPLDLYEVSTIVGDNIKPGTSGGITRQLTLADLGTDCPQTADPTAIATMVDSRCDPILAAPTQVRNWAYPCNACGRFGLFDPPYAVPTITGGLVPEPTTIVTIPPPVIVTATVAPITSVVPPPVPVESGVVVVEYFDQEGRFLSSSVLPTTGFTGTVTRSVTVFPVPTSVVETESVIETTGAMETFPSIITTSPAESSSDLNAAPLPTSTVATASAERFVGGNEGRWWIVVWSFGLGGLFLIV